MRILTIISLLSSILNIGIKSDYIINVTNNTGNSSYANIAQLTYWYTSDDSNYEVELSAPQLLGLTSVYQQTYMINININFNNPIESAHMTFKLPVPRNSSHRADFNIIAENAYVLSNFSDTIDVTAYNTDFVHIKLIFSWEQLEEYYGLTRNLAIAEDPDVNYWATDGNLHVYVSQFQVDAVTLSTSSDYNTQLNSLIANTDTIESLLTAISNNTSINNTINTNIINLNSKLTNLNNINKVTQAAVISQKLSLVNIDNVLNGNYVLYDDGIAGTFASNTLIFDSEDDDYSAFNRNKLKVVIELTTSEYMFAYIPTPTPKAQRQGPGGLADNATSYYFYVYNAYTGYAQRYEFSFTFNLTKLYVKITCYQCNLNSQTTSSPSWNNFGIASIRKLYITDASVTNEELSADILEAISSLSSINIEDDPNENTMQQFYETLKQSMNLPDMPVLDPNILRKIKVITDPVVRMFNLGELEIFNFMFRFGVLAMLFGVIFL